MKKYCIKTILLLVMILGWNSCSDEHESVLYHYVHFMLPDGTGSANILSESDALNTYYIYMSSDPISHPVDVQYMVECEYLVEGVDYELLEADRTLTFLPGVYEMPVRIHWLPNKVDASRRNTLTLKLVSCSDARMNLGMPGPDHLFDSLVFTKVNQ